MAQITTAELATELDTSLRNTRKFLRAADLGVGKGSRYLIEKRDLRSLRSRFAKWEAAKLEGKDVSKVDADADA